MGLKLLTCYFEYMAKPQWPTLSVETQIALSDAALALADLLVIQRSATGLATLEKFITTLIPYMSDAEVSYIGLSEYLDFAAACVRDGEDPNIEPSTVRERRAFEAQLAAARHLL
jgi:hypothetical protein